MSEYEQYQAAQKGMVIHFQSFDQWIQEFGWNIWQAARRTVSGQEAEWWEVTRDGEREVVSADHYHRHDWPRSTARPLFAAPIPATEPKAR